MLNVFELYCKGDSDEDDEEVKVEGSDEIVSVKVVVMKVSGGCCQKLKPRGRRHNHSKNPRNSADENPPIVAAAGAVLEGFANTSHNYVYQFLTKLQHELALSPESRPQRAIQSFAMLSFPKNLETKS